ncbi:mCG1025451 [Mus musculus]|nr:mCG1025451 [Mus musculus]
MTWVLQAPKKGMESMVHPSVTIIFNGGDSTYYPDAMKGQFTISRDVAKNTLYLKINNLRSEYNAIYISCMGWIFPSVKTCHHHCQSEDKVYAQQNKKPKSRGLQLPRPRPKGSED